MHFSHIRRQQQAGQLEFEELGRWGMEAGLCRVSLEFDKFQHPPPLSLFDRGNELELELCQAVTVGN